MAESKAIRAKGEDEIDKGDAGTASIDGRARFLTLSNNEKWRSLFPPLKDEPKAMADLRVDLAEVPVLAQDGKVTNIYDKLEAEPLSRKDKDMIWHCLALVRESYILRETPLLPRFLAMLSKIAATLSSTTSMVQKQPPWFCLTFLIPPIAKTCTQQSALSWLSNNTRLPHPNLWRALSLCF